MKIIIQSKIFQKFMWFQCCHNNLNIFSTSCYLTLIYNIYLVYRRIWNYLFKLLYFSRTYTHTRIHMKWNEKYNTIPIQKTPPPTTQIPSNIIWKCAHLFPIYTSSCIYYLVLILVCHTHTHTYTHMKS